MKRKRWHRPKARPGELIARWGKLPYEKPSICYAWGGKGAGSCDGRLLHGMFEGFGYPEGYLKELETRGYDLTTLRFSIRQRTKEDLHG